MFKVKIYIHQEVLCHSSFGNWVVMAKTILCIRSLDDDLDPHIQAVLEQVKLLDNEAKFVCLNPYSRGHYIEITAGKDSELSPSCVIVVDGDRIPAQSITSVWYRMKPVILKGDEDLQGRSFIFKNFQGFLFCCCCFFLLFMSVVKGHPATCFCKITVRRSTYCLEISKA